MERMLLAQRNQDVKKSRISQKMSTNLAIRMEKTRMTQNLIALNQRQINSVRKSCKFLRMSYSKRS